MADPPGPPADEAELLFRARAIAGARVGDLGREFGVDVPQDQRRAKGLVGQLIERVLGATAKSSDQPDFEELGIELKTIPVDRQGKPQESTFVCTIPLKTIAETDWEESRVHGKLSHVLWVPVESSPEIPLPARRVGAAVLWRPSEEEETVLREDWDELAGLIGHGDVDQITAHLGQALQIRPKAAHSRVRTRAPEADGAWLATLPRGFYLRTSFTARMLARAFEADGNDGWRPVTSC